MGKLLKIVSQNLMLANWQNLILSLMNSAESKGLFGDYNDHEVKGGLKGMGDAMKRGMVLVLSLWDDHAAHMLWLDSNYPPDGDAMQPGVARGPCSTDSGDPLMLKINKLKQQLYLV